MIILYGFLKLVLMLFEGALTTKNAKITICIEDKKENHTALIDSGNLLIDPISNTPVIIIKKKHSEFFKDNDDILQDEKLKTRVRLIPAKGVGSIKILTAVRSDYILINDNRRFDNYIFAIDEEDGTYGGYTALMPATLTGN